jgi:DNA polymerase-3 subunit alpha
MIKMNNVDDQVWSQIRDQVSEAQILRQKAYEGLEERGFLNDRIYIERLEHELNVIQKQGFEPYFLIMWDIAKFVNNHPELIAGPARGSAASSLVLYSLQVTHVNPIKHSLYFSRFLNENRVSPPDVDYDVNNRDIVIDYIEDKYGKDRVARVGSINFLRTKSAIRDVSRVLQKDYKFVDELANLVPPPVAGLWDSFEDECKVEPKLLDPKYSDIMDVVKEIYGLARSYGTHAGGIAISPVPVNQVVPLYKNKDGDPVSQFDWRDLEKAGLLKFDILGLSTLEVISVCSNYIKTHNPNFNVMDIEDGDQKSYDLICSGKLDGIFQLGGSSIIKQLTVSIAPRSIDEIAIVTALCRPGPLTSGMVNDAVDIRQGKKEPTYIHEALIPILQPTYSVPIFQEQVMKICTDLCGYSQPDADYVRKCMGKKLKKELKKEKGKFVNGAISNGLSRNDATDLFSKLEDYAQYLFVKSHAVAYSYITYYTAYLKAHYPVEFYSGLLSCETDSDRVIQYSSTVRTEGINILPPDINLSDVDHKPEGKSIRFGLGHIKGMPTATAKEIVRVRREIS